MIYVIGLFCQPLNYIVSPDMFGLFWHCFNGNLGKV